MWIVVVVDHYYPSVFHFDNEDEANTCYDKQSRMGYAVHLAKVEKSKYDEEVFEFDLDRVETLDVEWYTSR